MCILLCQQSVSKTKPGQSESSSAMFCYQLSYFINQCLYANKENNRSIHMLGYGLKLDETMCCHIMN